MKKTVKLAASTFLEDFIRGEPDEALRKKYELTPSDLSHVINELRQRGRITPEVIAGRRAQLKVRFGSEDGPADPAREGEVAVDLDTGWVLYCPSCGAPVRREATRCDYCSAALDFSLKGKTVNCPNCFAATPADGRFCVRCSRPVRGMVRDDKIMDDRICPRCTIPMRAKEIGEFHLIGCDKCAGVFVPHDVFDMMQEKRDSVVFSAIPPQKGQTPVESNASYVRCPVCKQMVNRVNFARISGVIVDVCRQHGIWFDGGEIEKIMDFVAHGGLQRAKQVDVERLKAEEELIKLKSNSGTRASVDTSWGDFAGKTGHLDLLGSLGWAFGLFKD
jgi:Zn-finger nucleic acid-binding protein